MSVGVHERRGANRGMWVGKAVSARRCAVFVEPFSFARPDDRSDGVTFLALVPTKVGRQAKEK